VNNKSWLEAENINAFKKGYKVINNLTLKFNNNERIFILGPNGSGKSSIVDLINRNIYPIICKNSSFKLFNKEFINIWEVRKYISTVNNEIKSRINPHLKVFDILISGLYGTFCKIKNPKREDIYAANKLITQINLRDISDKDFGCLSDGEKQITLIARSIINNPKVLILDEPATNLDLKSKHFLIDKIQYLSKLGISILCITHDISIITNDFNRVILLKDRKIIGDGTPNKLMNSENINNLFEINVKLIKNCNSWDVIRN
tara:strand:+ start:1369 stop:2151 length:783 start_codon:yes stop_codon:yes gene_type:complete